MAPPLLMNLPDPSPRTAHDGCPALVRLAAVEGRQDATDSRLDALSDEVRSISAEVARFSDAAADFKASLARTEALNIEIGLQLKRFSEFAGPG